MIHKIPHSSFKAIIPVEKDYCVLKGGIWTRSVIKCSCLKYKLVLTWLVRLLNIKENQNRMARIIDN